MYFIDPTVYLGDLSAESGQTLQGSFSAVSKLNFTSKYSLELDGIRIYLKRRLRRRVGPSQFALPKCTDLTYR